MLCAASQRAADIQTRRSVALSLFRAQKGIHPLPSPRPPRHSLSVREPSHSYVSHHMTRHGHSASAGPASLPGASHTALIPAPPRRRRTASSRGGRLHASGLPSPRRADSLEATSRRPLDPVQWGWSQLAARPARSRCSRLVRPAIGCCPLGSL
eukprot:360089-Chlamydomonas_euryale.AAC.2